MSKVNNDYSSMFNSLYSSQSGQTNGSTSFIGDWASLKNGSMKKLTKAYYAKTAAGEKAAQSEENKEAVKANNKVKTAATDLKKSVSEVKDTDSLKKFVKDYNAMLSAGSDSDSQGVLRNTLSITKLTEAHKNTLSKLGVTIGEDNKLSLNEETAEKASTSDFNSLFKGTGSYGDLVAARTAEAINRANYENNKMNSYTAGGTYSAAGAVGNIYDGSY